MALDPALKGIGQEPGIRIWRINKFTLEEVPKEQYGNFYNGDSYIVLNTKSVSDSAEYEVHFWLGSGTSQDEMGTAAIKTVELDDALDGLPVQYREIQYHESPLFLSYFKDGIKYLEGGVETGFNHVVEPYEHWKPKLFQCKGRRNVRCKQVKCVKESLNTGDVFILDNGLDIFVWLPPESGRLERIKGMQQAKSIRDQERAGRPKIHILDKDWDCSDGFWHHFGGCQMLDVVKNASAGGDDEQFWLEDKAEVSMWKVSDSAGKMEITKIKQGQLNVADLDSNDAFIVDAVSGGLFVWVGKHCTMDERKKAMDWGQQYIAKQKRSQQSQQIIRVLEGAEPEFFAQWFADWSPTKKAHAFKPKLYQCSNEGGKLRIEEIANFRQEDLDGDDVMILDALNTIYVWIGVGANNEERDAAKAMAKKYLESGTAPRLKDALIEVIIESQEPPSFKKLFPSWDDHMFDNQTRSYENMRKLLFQ